MSSHLTTRVPDELIALRQWVIWRREMRDGKPTKAPYTCQGYRASHSNPDTWSAFDVALKAAARPGFADGMGFVITPADPYCGIDLDDIWLSDADEGAPWAMRILDRFNDTYSEISPSDGGVKIWCRAKAPRCGKWDIEHGAIEIYDRNRFFTVTGRWAGVRAITDHQSDIDVLFANLDDGPNRAQGQPASDVIPQGQRHNTLVSLAGTMHKRGMLSEAIEAALLETNRLQCDPPYDADHIRQIVQSTQRWPR